MWFGKSFPLQDAGFLIAPLHVALLSLIFYHTSLLESSRVL